LAANSAHRQPESETPAAIGFRENDGAKRDRFVITFDHISGNSDPELNKIAL
jgi:hypothetical protein